MSGKHGQISLQEGGEGRGGPHYRGRATLDILMTIHKTARADRLVYQSLFPRRVICVIRAGVVEVTGAVGGGRLEAGGAGAGILSPTSGETYSRRTRLRDWPQNMSRIYLYCIGRAVYQERVPERSQVSSAHSCPAIAYRSGFGPILMSDLDVVCVSRPPDGTMARYGSKRQAKLLEICCSIMATVLKGPLFCRSCYTHWLILRALLFVCQINYISVDLEVLRSVCSDFM